MLHLFILNSYAGARDITGELKSKIDSLKLDGRCVVEYTKSKGDAKRIAEQYVASTDEFVRVYACGGDGTANEAMCGMVNYDNCALGVIPVGTGNDFVRSLGTNKENFLDFEKMTKADTVKIDLLACGGLYAMNTISVGYDCAVAKEAPRFKRLPFVSGSMAYKISILYCLLTKRRHTFVPYADDQRVDLPTGYGTQMLAIAGNGKFYGGGIKATPLAELSDGMIDFVSIPTVSVVKFIGLLGTFINGEHINNDKVPFILHKKCKKLTLKDDKNIDIGLDGEIYSMKNPEITVLPRAFSVIIPDGSTV